MYWSVGWRCVERQITMCVLQVKKSSSKGNFCFLTDWLTVEWSQWKAHNDVLSKNGIHIQPSKMDEDNDGCYKCFQRVTRHEPMLCLLSEIPHQKDLPHAWNTNAHRVPKPSRTHTRTHTERVRAGTLDADPFFCVCVCVACTEYKERLQATHNNEIAQAPSEQVLEWHESMSPLKWTRRSMFLNHQTTGKQHRDAVCVWVPLGACCSHWSCIGCLGVDYPNEP